MDLLENRPQKITDILTSMKYWDEFNTRLFLREFVEFNCEKINFMFDLEKIEDVVNAMEMKDIKSNIIHLLQSIKSLDEITLPRAYQK